jgi:hypothetical protein
MSHPITYLTVITIAGCDYSVKYSYLPGCPATRSRSGGLIDPGDDAQVELLEVAPVDITAISDLGPRELERRIEAELYKHHSK